MSTDAVSDRGDALRQAAEAGDAEAMRQYALRLLGEDPQAARNWLHRAADLGNLRARNELAMLAAQDSGQPLDPAHPPAKDPRETGLIIAIEQGRYSPSLEVAFQIARVFKVGLDDVFQYPDADK